MGLPLWFWVEKSVHGGETHWLSSKENIVGTIVSWETNSLLGYETEIGFVSDLV